MKNYSKANGFLLWNLIIDQAVQTFHSAFTETGATQTMKTNQMAELKQ